LYTLLEAQNAYLLDEIRTEQNFGDIIGGSSGLRKVMQQVQLVAPTDWPGNVRELQNTVERAIILWREGPLTFDLPGTPKY
jgi:transcriptional regulator with GAF, ATPase, and Fis domain